MENFMKLISTIAYLASVVGILWLLIIVPEIDNRHILYSIMFCTNIIINNKTKLE